MNRVLSRIPAWAVFLPVIGRLLLLSITRRSA